MGLDQIITVAGTSSNPLSEWTLDLTFPLHPERNIDRYERHHVPAGEEEEEGQCLDTNNGATDLNGDDCSYFNSQQFLDLIPESQEEECGIVGLVRPSRQLPRRA